MSDTLSDILEAYFADARRSQIRRAADEIKEFVRSELTAALLEPHDDDYRKLVEVLAEAMCAKSNGTAVWSGATPLMKRHYQDMAKVALDIMMQVTVS